MNVISGHTNKMMNLISSGKNYRLVKSEQIEFTTPGKEFTDNTDRILNLKPKDVKEVGINRTTLHNVKGKINDNEYDNITDNIKIKILSALKNN